MDFDRLRRPWPPTQAHLLLRTFTLSPNSGKIKEGYHGKHKISSTRPNGRCHRKNQSSIKKPVVVTPLMESDQLKMTESYVVSANWVTRAVPVPHGPPGGVPVCFLRGNGSNAKNSSWKILDFFENFDFSKSKMFSKQFSKTQLITENCSKMFRNNHSPELN